eukprot:9491149-Pyramimonas_sp.AAC.1
MTIHYVIPTVAASATTTTTTTTTTATATIATTLFIPTATNYYPWIINYQLLTTSTTSAPMT